MCFPNDYLQKDEQIVRHAKTSRSALLITWASIPGFYLITGAVVYIPAILRALFNSAVRRMIFGEGRSVSLFSYVRESALEWIPAPLLTFAKVLFGILVTVWLIWCLIMTRRHFRYKLAITDRRVIGFAAGEQLDAPLSDVVNVYLEQSLWGKILHYGSVVIQTTKQSLTFKNIHRAPEIKDLLMSYAEKY